MGALGPTGKVPTVVGRRPKRRVDFGQDPPRHGRTPGTQGTVSIQSLSIRTPGGTREKGDVPRQKTEGGVPKPKLLRRDF